MELYKYQPIDLETHSFRLIRLLKGSGAFIECEMFDARLDRPEDLIPYNALSYVWGGVDLSNRVRIGGKWLNVTPNLYLALKYLRHKDCDYIFWIDALCIDQSNLQERGHQVQNMSKIYSLAEKVVVWMGPSTAETRFTMSSMRQLHAESTKYAHRGWDDSEWGKLWSRIQSLTTLDPSINEVRQISGMEELLSRSWWKRVWVIQEIATARVAEVVCGSESIPASIFNRIPSLLGIQVTSHCQAVLSVMPGPLRQRSWWNTQRDLHTLLQNFKECEATDPRDKIYALLNLSSDASDSKVLMPDYTKSDGDVIQALMIQLFSLSGIKISDSIAPEWNSIPSFLKKDSAEVIGRVFQWAMIDQKHEEAARVLLLRSGTDPNMELFTIGWPKLAKMQELPGFHYGPQIIYLPGLPMFTMFEGYNSVSPLILAAGEGLATVVELLLDHPDIDVNRTLRPWEKGRNNNFDGCTPLMLSMKGHYQAISALLLSRQDVNVNIQDSQGCTALIYAVKSRNRAGIELLLGRQDINLNIRDSLEHTALIHALRGTDQAIVELLLKRDDIDIDVESRYGPSPLLYAIQQNSSIAISRLLKRKAFKIVMTPTYNHPLLRAVDMNSSEDAFELLLGHDEIWTGETASKMGLHLLLHLVAEEYYTALDLLFARKEVNVNARHPMNGKTLLAWAASIGNQKLVLKLLNREDIDLYPTNNLVFTETPLYLAVANGHEETTVLLLDRYNVRDHNTAFLYAVLNGTPDIVRVLLQQSTIDVNFEDGAGRTALSLLASVSPHDNMLAKLAILLQCDNLEVNSRDRKGRTPLHWAIMKDAFDMAERLLERGDINVNLKDASESTPLSLAAHRDYYGDLRLVRLLVEKGAIERPTEQ